MENRFAEKDLRVLMDKLIISYQSTSVKENHQHDEHDWAECYQQDEVVILPVCSALMRSDMEYYQDCP